MKLIRELLGLISLIAFSRPIVAEVMTPVTFNEAFTIIQMRFSNQDADYYKLEDGDDTKWAFFINADPLAERMHKCYIATMPKFRIKGTTLNSIVPDIATCTSLPIGELEILSVKRRYDERIDYRPRIKKNPNAYQENPMAERTYAIIISGGEQPIINWDRYWNNCSFIYQTLVNTYGIPKDNIYPMIADGNDPRADMNPSEFPFLRNCVNQSLDLDLDGVDDISMAATKENVKNTLMALENKVQDGDHQTD